MLDKLDLDLPTTDASILLHIPISLVFLYIQVAGKA
jgi:hypothetical protein